MEFERRNGHGNGYGNGNANGYGNGLIYDRLGFEERECGGDNSPTMASLKVFPVSSSSTSSAPSSSSSSPLRYIEHHVTKLDTLAGVAIRYGVEVSDIKKLNGLTTDLQMFALKTLHIPLPGRHPPSPCLSNGHSASGQTSSEQTPTRRLRSDFLDSFQSLKATPERRVSPAMSSLQGYYGLHGRRKSSEGFEMAVYNKGSPNYHHDEALTTPSLMNPPLSHHRRSRSLANGFKTDECDPTEDTSPMSTMNTMNTNVDKWFDKLSRRRQKSEADFAQTPEKLLKEENGSSSWFSAITGKGLALRTKAASRINLAADAEAGGLLSSPVDSLVAESTSGVRKSSSTPSLQDQENSNSSSIWSTSKWSSLKPDLQAALAKPIFDGLPKPITGRRAKAALD